MFVLHQEENKVYSPFTIKPKYSFKKSKLHDFKIQELRHAPRRRFYGILGKLRVAQVTPTTLGAVVSVG